MSKVIILNKKEGETPLEALESFCKKNKEYANTPMTYAGRLDPMASGLLLILAGGEIRKKEKYLNLDKEYVFEILFGFSTDTHDILGIANTNNFFGSSVLRVPLPARPLKNCSHLQFQEAIKKEIKKFIGKQVQKYPMYSSRTVKGKPLFAYARSGEEVEAPEREINIKKLILIKTRKISSKKLLENIENKVSKVKGDFRQDEILKVWRKKLKNNEAKYTLASFKVKCSSGTYVRVLADAFGKGLNQASLAYSIRRTKIGKFVL